MEEARRADLAIEAVFEDLQVKRDILMRIEALRLFEKGVATPGDIDKAMRLGLGHPMGPFELMDMVGLDVVLRARMGIYDETRDPNHAPPAILRRMVAAGRLGRKSGRGFYDYETLDDTPYG